MTSFPATPVEQRWLDQQEPATNPHPMAYTGVKLTVHCSWTERHVMERLSAMLPGATKDSAPFGPRETGYRWQLDATNDWWAQLDCPSVTEYPDTRRVTPDGTPQPVLTVVHRYSLPKARALAEWAAVVFGGKVLHPRVYSFQLAREGGAWLGAARDWMQRRFVNGSDVTWGSHDLLKGAPITVADIEEVAARAAAEAINERNGGRI